MDIPLWYGFAKNEKENVSEAELEALKLLAKDLLGLTATELARAIEAGELLELCDEKDHH